MSVEQLIAHLVKKGMLVSTEASITPLTGGVSCEILLIDDGENRYVLKRALEKLKVKDDWFADIKRNTTEQKFLSYVGGFLPESVPQILYADEEHHFFCMEMLENGLENWKTLLLNKQFNKVSAQKAGALLGCIHSRSAGDSKAEKVFDTLESFKQLRIEPYLLKTGERHPELQHYYNKEASRLASKKECLVHGDFSPKNILVNSDRLVILDCEVAWYGDPIFDLAFFLNHFALKALLHNEEAETVLDLFLEVWDAYKKKASLLIDSEFEQRLTHLLTMLMLARVDGKSPVEYLNNKQQQIIRTFAYQEIPTGSKSLEEFKTKWLNKITMKIKEIDAYQIYDSRGFPTLEVEVTLENGIKGYGLVPSGASTGQFEALELRDGDKEVFRGKSVFKAIENVKTLIAEALKGVSVFEQEQIDKTMIELDGTTNKSNLGANAILGVSMAVANTAANAKGVPLYEYLGNGEGHLIPLNEIQILGGGAHAAWATDIQDYLVIATGAKTYEETLEMTHNIYHAAGEVMKARGKCVGIADEGGWWPDYETNEEPFDVFLEAVEKAGYIAGKDVAISLDIAASDLFDGEKYRFRLDNKEFTPDEFCNLMIAWCEKYPIISIEDPFADTDFESWKRFMEVCGNKVQVIGDDLFTTNIERIKEGIANELANSVLIKLNQIGSVTETIQAIKLTQSAGWLPVVSARSGETEDAFISHLAVATNAGQLKVGSFARSERMVKWNENIRIQRSLGDKATFIGAKIYDIILEPELLKV
ncbi:phosphopyruvate hydratase [Seonamhaeicola maritimus]|uniref:phosphopyruvate hydratase n=1 Tax=Seonamhaeicola maritimus TaxID=2591822 RepID=UPI00249404C2|nr:phosphopyruvate hydratase [Seonamhaeicola maritimus]